MFRPLSRSQYHRKHLYSIFTFSPLFSILVTIVDYQVENPEKRAYIEDLVGMNHGGCAGDACVVRNPDSIVNLKMHLLYLCLVCLVHIQEKINTYKSNTYYIFVWISKFDLICLSAPNIRKIIFFYVLSEAIL